MGGGQGGTERQRKHTIQKTSRAENGGRRWREVGGVMWRSVGLVTCWKWVESLQVGGVTQIGGVIFRVVTEGA